MKNRSRFQIVAEILELTLKGSKKTRIMYAASLSFTQLNNYLALLIDRGLIAYNEKTKIYKTTSAGLEVLKQYRKLKL